MSKKFLIISGSPQKEGNTAALINWFCEGAQSKGADVEVMNAAFLKFKALGCLSCRGCQQSSEYQCVIDDDVRPIQVKMLAVDVIVMASPLYFFGPSAQLKVIIDRMFALYKWDNAAGTMVTPLKGKKLVLLGSAFEDIGLDTFEKPFALTAAYTSMRFDSLIIPNAGISGEIHKIKGVREQVIAFGQKMA